VPQTHSQMDKSCHVLVSGDAGLISTEDRGPVAAPGPPGASHVSGKPQASVVE
jgi:hypothetical protein